MDFLVIKPLIDRLVADAPYVSFDVVVHDGPRTWKQIELGELDLCLGTLNYYSGELNQQQLYSDRVMGAVWAGHPEIDTQVTSEQLDRLPHALHKWPERSEGGREWQLRGELPVRVAHEHHITRLLLLRQTTLVAFASEKLVSVLGTIADIRVVEPPFPPEVIRQGMLWHPHDTDDPAHEWLREHLADIGASLQAGLGCG